MFANLFTFDRQYPNQPGYRRTDTSETAAEAVAPKAKVVREKVLACVRSQGSDGATSKEVADQLEYAYETVQPRLSELKAKGLVRDSGLRRQSRDKSKLAIVWVAP